VNWDLVDDLAGHWAGSGDKICLGTRDWKNEPSVDARRRHQLRRPDRPVVAAAVMLTALKGTGRSSPNTVQIEFWLA
jgi:hypothetical protein